MQKTLHFFSSNYFQSLAILTILMIASEKSHQNLSDSIQFLIKTDFNLTFGEHFIRDFFMCEMNM